MTEHTHTHTHTHTHGRLYVYLVMFVKEVGKELVARLAQFHCTPGLKTEPVTSMYA